MRVNVKFDYAGTIQHYDRKLSKAQAWLNNEIVKDSNFYAPADTTDLIKSAVRYVAANPEAGEVVWDVPYAQYQYNGVSKTGKPLNYSKDTNPHARKKWVLSATISKKKKWTRGVAKIMEGEVK